MSVFIMIQMSSYEYIMFIVSTILFFEILFSKNNHNKLLYNVRGQYLSSEGGGGGVQNFLGDSYDHLPPFHPLC